ncbi:MAG: TPM domain-containing protein [Chitinophagaceae bacterium]
MRFLISILFTFLSCIGFTQSKALPLPSAKALVIDNASLLNEFDKQQLEKKLVELDRNTTNQISVVTVNSLNGLPIEEVAYETFKAWGIGGKKNNNGILILISKEDRKIKIEVGYGLEGAIPDIIAKRIIVDDLRPAFKLGNYYSGINAAVDNLAKAATGEYNVKRERNKGNGNGFSSIIFFVIVAIIIIIILSNRGGGRGNGYYRRPSASDFILPMLFNNSGWGGGGSSSGGGDSWGGFDGFGGGSSGGGGASGDW